MGTSSSKSSRCCARHLTRLPLNIVPFNSNGIPSLFFFILNPQGSDLEERTKGRNGKPTARVRRRPVYWLCRPRFLRSLLTESYRTVPTNIVRAFGPFVRAKRIFLLGEVHTVPTTAGQAVAHSCYFRFVLLSV